MSIRPASPADLTRIAQLDSGAWSTASTPAPLSRISDGIEDLPLADTLVFDQAGDLYGYASIGRRASFASNAHVGWVRVLAVDPAYRRRGVGRALLRAIEVLAKQRGHGLLRLFALATNQPALALYAQAGFAEIARLPDEFFIDDRFVDDVLLSKQLG